ncbi:hypothetical protein DRE_00457 [Drechslerella stenobrocha 248]|uniref:Growth hormone-inducible transmembrane protein n=1 Tax=Drechslerella stenobrocha 248 TaxID=1043628 RepID=W7HVF7_9PEZI|nr:hypothetical protein DRE_00457 [Drechslerella stenobrocha 248]
MMSLRRPLASCAAARPASTFASIAKQRYTATILKPRTFTAAFSSTRTIAAPRPSITNISKSFQSALQFAKPQARNASFSAADAAVSRPAPPTVLSKLLYTAAVFGSTAFAIHFIFNRETRDGPIPAYQREYLHETFMYTGLGVGMIGVAAKALHGAGWSYRLMAMNPWVFMGVSLVGGIGTMMATYACPPENYVAKHALWSTFNLSQAAILSPMLFFNPAILARAGLYTVGMMGAISYVGATAKTDQYLYLGGPLLAGLTVVALSGLAPLVLPATAARTLAFTENLWLYGGLAVFGGITLYDVQKVLYHSRMSEAGLKPRDTVNEAISLELDFINIFIRMVYILQGGNRKR